MEWSLGIQLLLQKFKNRKKNSYQIKMNKEKNTKQFKYQRYSMPYHYFIGKERTIDLLLSNSLSTSPQIQPDLCKYWMAAYLLLNEQSELCWKEGSHKAFC